MSAEGREEAGRTPATVIKMFVHKDWHLQCLMAMCVLTCVLSPVATLFPYGTSAGDTANPSSTTASSGPLSVSPALVFYNNTYNHLYVNNDGFISFTGNGTVFSLGNAFPNSYPAICIFGCDIAPRADGRVWHRVSSAASDIEGVHNITRRYDLGDSGTFVPTWVLVASWVQVHSPANTTTQGNTMQLTVATNGVTSVVMMEFSLISWVMDAIGSTSIRAQVGFNKGNSQQSYVLPESKSEALFNLPNRTNVGQPGFFLFRVDQDIVVPSLITTTAVTTITSTDPTTMTSPVTSTSTETTPAVTSTSTETTTAVTSTSTETTTAVTSTSTETTTAVTSTSTVTTTAVTSPSTVTTPAVTSTSTETTPAVTSTPTEASITYSERTETSTAATAKPTTTSTATDAATSEKATVTSPATPSTASSPATSAAITTSALTAEIGVEVKQCDMTSSQTSTNLYTHFVPGLTSSTRRADRIQLQTW
ncbi:mucin-5AC-like isoform X2 [Pomacea canaliculata]|uniref:mucin-5AC-like isoform X2 n=1 Tax=Pomacea canaliculata TaxID=400727 RepID=UPI000D7356A9|nr:mucin-5AC-like isoform X2 [Pomacea canaliculata]